MAIVLHRVKGVCGHDIGVLEAVHTAFRVLLYSQRLRPVQHQWAGSRFRNWRRNVNNEAQMVRDRSDCDAWVRAYYAQKDGPQLTLVSSQDGVALHQPQRSHESAAQEARARWRETDGFARIDP